MYFCTNISSSGCWWGTVAYKYLKVLAEEHRLLEEILQLLDGHLHHIVVYVLV